MSDYNVMINAAMSKCQSANDTHTANMETFRQLVNSLSLENETLRCEVSELKTNLDEQLKRLIDVCMELGPAMIQIHDLKADLLTLAEIAADYSEDVINEYHANYFTRGNPLQRHMDGMEELEKQRDIIKSLKQKHGLE